MSDPLKQAFAKVKQDILNLQSQISSLSREIQEIKRTLQPTPQQTDNPTNQTNQQIIPTHQQPQKALKPPISTISTGNEGVPTDRQTDQQTDRHIQKFAQNIEPNTISVQETDRITRLEQVSKALESLDDIKRDLRQQFKKLTAQEMLIFSSIYQLEEQGFIVDYPLLAQKLALSESSIRDYTLKLIKKGIPVDKTKLDNKKIKLSISQNLKKIASLNTILQLREL